MCLSTCDITCVAFPLWRNLGPLGLSLWRYFEAKLLLLRLEWLMSVDVSTSLGVQKGGIKPSTAGMGACQRPPLTAMR